jgi:hypothetical protein
MARTDRITDKPVIAMNADKPVRMSQIANKRKPIFLVMFMIISFLSVKNYKYICALYGLCGKTSSVNLGYEF